VLEKECKPRGPCISVTPEQKYAIGQRAAENGVAATLRYSYAKRFPDLPKPPPMTPGYLKIITRQT